MPSTYSINVGQLTESTRKQDIFNVLEDLPNNTQKLISPRDVRDAFLTTWANSSFKVTTASTHSSHEYIGIDSSNPGDRDIKQRILLGKRSFGNLDIMNDSLLNNSDADIFIYNTKPDSSSQSSTRLAILAGTDSTIHTKAPYIEGLMNNSGSAIDINITNPSPFGGDINIFSNTGRVAINGIVFPTAAETSASASNGKILRYSGTYPYGSLQWDDSNITISNIGSPGSPTNIYGSTVSLNGHSLEFIDDNVVPIPVGGITAGSSFPTQSFTAGGYTSSGLGQNWPISEVLRKVLYPYIEPVLELSIINPTTGTTYAEAGTTPTLEFDWSITTYAREHDESIRDFAISEDSASYTQAFFTGSSFSAIPGSSTGSVFTYATSSSNPSGIGTLDLSLYVSTDNTTNLAILQGGYPNLYSFSASECITWIDPVFYGFSPLLVASPASLQTVSNNLNKLIEPYKNGTYSLPYNGNGYLYFIYPASWDSGSALLKEIKDPNGYLIHDYLGLSFSSFTHSNHSNPTYGRQFKVYRTTNLVSYTGSGEFKFTF